MSQTRRIAFASIIVAIILFLVTTASFMFRDDSVSTLLSSPPPRHQNVVNEQSLSTAKTSTLLNDIVFSCFYFRPDFYHGRSVPSIDWILVMIESAYEHRFRPVSSNEQQQSLRIVMFVDKITKTKLSETIQDRAAKKKRTDFISNGFLELVLISDAEDTEFAHLVETSAWANSNRLKNAANNFRFWLIRRYILANILPFHQNQAEQQLSQVRVAICDATDVLFQRNPFLDDVCFPQKTTSSKKQQQQQQHEQQHVFLFTLEDASKNFHNERYNRRWMQCYQPTLKTIVGNASQLASLPSNNPLSIMDKGRMRVSCAGVSFGSLGGVLVYLNAQLLEISREALVSCAIDTIKAALDQATHNYLMLYGAAWSAAPLPTTTMADESGSSGGGAKNNDGTATWRRAIELTQEQLRSASLHSIFDGIKKVSHVFVAAAVPGVSERRRQSNTNRWSHWDSFSFSSGTAAAAATTDFSWSPFSSPADCVFHGNFGKLRMDEAGRNVVSGSVRALPFAVVHQYTSDRHPVVMKLAKKTYKV